MKTIEQVIQETLEREIQKAPATSQLTLFDTTKPFDKIIDVLIKVKEKIEGVHIYPNITDSQSRTAQGVLQLENDTIYYLSVSDCNTRFFRFVRDVERFLGKREYAFFALTDKGIYSAMERGKNRDRIAVSWTDVRRIYTSVVKSGYDRAISIECNNGTHVLFPEKMGIEMNEYVLDNFADWLMHIAERIQEITNTTPETILLEMIDKFWDFDYRKRQFIMFGSPRSYSFDGNLMLLPIDKLPKDINFPIGHPQAYELYVCHPTADKMYIPYETSEFEIFKSKLHELIYILQKLGAVKINLLDDGSGELNIKDTTDVKAEANAKKSNIKADGSADYKSASEEYMKMRQKYEIGIVNDPQGRPELPDDLIWYKYEPDWQNMVRERFAGIKTYNVSLCSDSNIRIHKQKQLELKAEYEKLLKANGKLNIDCETIFSHNVSTKWTLSIEFASLKELMPAAKDAVVPKPFSDNVWKRFWRWLRHLFVR